MQHPEENKTIPLALHTVIHAAKSFGKAFVLYAVPMSILRRELKVDVFRRAGALASFMGIAKAFQMILSRQKSKTLKYYAQAIGGGLGASIALSIDSGLGYNTLVIWFAIRAFLCVLEEHKQTKFIANIPNMPTVVMCLSASQILSCWIRYPSELDQNYKKFLDYQGGRPKWVLNRSAAPNSAYVFPFSAVRKPNTTLYTDAIYFFFAGLKRAGKLYIPLYIVTFLYGLIQKQNHSSHRILKLLKHFIGNTVRSCIFLSLYCTIAWTWFPFIGSFVSNPAPRGATRILLRRHGWFAGLATLVERKERRPLLATYCATYAIDSIWRRMEMSTPFLKTIKPALATLILVVSCSILLHHYEKQPTLVTKWILGFSAHPTKPKEELEPEIVAN